MVTTRPTYIVGAMRLELEQLRLLELLSGGVDESVFVVMLVELTQLMADGVDARLSTLDHVAVGRHLHQQRSTHCAVEAEIHHLHSQHTPPF